MRKITCALMLAAGVLTRLRSMAYSPVLLHTNAIYSRLDSDRICIYN